MQWNEDAYEKQLIERTTDACGGPVDVVLNFGTTSRSLHRSLQCLALVGLSISIAKPFPMYFAIIIVSLSKKMCREVVY